MPESTSPVLTQAHESAQNYTLNRVIFPNARSVRTRRAYFIALALAGFTNSVSATG